MAAFKQEVNVPLILTLGAVSGIILLVTIIGVESWYDGAEQDEIAAQNIEFPNTDLKDLQDGQKTFLERTQWTNKDHNAVAIPIEKAMAELIKTHGVLPTTEPAATTK
jgi:hypothetical protein